MKQKNLIEENIEAMFAFQMEMARGLEKAIAERNELKPFAEIVEREPRAGEHPDDIEGEDESKVEEAFDLHAEENQ